MKANINTFIKPSKIHGLGLFAKTDIKKGERIIQGYADFNYRTEWIKYVKKWKITSFAHNNGYCMVNHSDNPNTFRDKKIQIIAVENILAETEITEDYNKLSDQQNPFKNPLEEIIYHYRRNKK